MNHAVTALMVGMFLANVQDHPKKSEVPVETFSQKYFSQLDKTNAALRVYTNTPCTEPEFKAAAQNLSKQAAYLQGMYHNIPLDEDDIVSAHEIEAYIGFVTVANDSVDQQNQCLKSVSNPGDSKGAI